MPQWSGWSSEIWISYLGTDLPRGNVRLAWSVGMIIVVLISVVGASVKVVDALGALFRG